MEGSKDTGLKIQAFLVGPLNRLLTNYLSAYKGMGAYTSQTLFEILAGCSERPSSKAAASEDRRRTLWGARCDE